MKNVVIIDHFSKAPNETGNNRFVYLADMLCSYGYNVEIITTQFAHLKKKQRIIDKEELSKLPYRYTMLPEPEYSKNVCIKRFISHYIFGKNLTRYLRHMQKPDLVLISVPSLDVGTAARKYCKKNRIPFIVDIQDLWPEAFKLVFKVPVISDCIFFPMTVQADKIYAGADKIIAVSETYKKRGLKSNKKDFDGLCVYLGTDLKKFDENSKSRVIEKPNDELWIAYVGTLGHSYNIEIIFDALNKIADDIDKKVVFQIYGDGPYMERFKEYSKDCRVKCVFHGRLNYADMTSCLVNSDIAVNPIVKGAAQSIINKHADYAAAGLPIVNTQECPEYRELIDKYECGINCDVESVDQVADALARLINDDELRIKMGKQSRLMAEECFDRAETYKAIINEIEKLV